MLTAIQLQFYKENGYVILDDVYSTAEIDECSFQYDRLFELKNNSDLEATWKGDWKNAYSNYTDDVQITSCFFFKLTKDLITLSFQASSTQLLSIHNLQNHAAIFTQMLLKDTLLDAVSQIIGSDDILLHHTKAHVKPPGKGSPFPMHQASFIYILPFL